MIRIRATLTRRRDRLGVLAAAFVLALGVTWAHGAMGADHMDDSGAGSATAISVCLGILEAGGAATALAGALLLLARMLRRRRSDPARLPASELPARWLDRPRVRAGPAELQVFRL